VPVPVLPTKHHLDKRALALIEQANAGTDDELLSTLRTAVWLDVSPQWLEIGRSRGYGPKFIKLSPKRVRYRRGDVKCWLQERAHSSTNEYADAARPQGRPPGSKVVDGRVILPDPTPRRRAVLLRRGERGHQPDPAA
jgi:hypothetical protein